jgi:hypothetical protein
MHVGNSKLFMIRTVPGSFLRYCIFTGVCIACMFTPGSLYAQLNDKTDHDTTYYESYPRDVILRLISSYKYTNFQMRAKDRDMRLNYLPNSYISLGAGFTYRTLSVNIAHGFGFLNQDKEKGKLKRSDLQLRMYGRKWAIDVFGQFYKGYYLDPKGKGSLMAEQYYTRPDLKVHLAGISAYRIFNYNRFTLRPAFVQDEWQKRSAGSILAGFELYYGNFTGDSALVPSVLSINHRQRNINTISMVQFGPGAGYAYTLVLPFHFFVTGSVQANVNLGLVRQTGNALRNSHTGVNANMHYRFSAGYANGNWNINFFRINHRQSVKADGDGNRFMLNTGIYRVLIAKRFSPGIKAKKLLRPVDMIMDLTNRK